MRLLAYFSVYNNMLTTLPDHMVKSVTKEANGFYTVLDTDDEAHNASDVMWLVSAADIWVSDVETEFTPVNIDEAVKALGIDDLTANALKDLGIIK